MSQHPLTVDNTMKRRDFVKFAALLPVAPAMVVASQFAEPKQTSTTHAYRFSDGVARNRFTPPTDRDVLAYRDALAKCLDAGHGCCSETGFTYIDTQRDRINGFWTTFDDVKEQTNFLKGQFGNKENFWLNDNGDFKDFNTVSYVKTFTVRGGGVDRDVTKLSFGYMWFCVWAGAKISINASAPSIRIEQTNPETGKALDWKWTRETYKETAIRIAIEFDAFNPKWLVSLARAYKVPQTQIKKWMWDKKYGHDKLVLQSHFRADVTSGIGK